MRSKKKSTIKLIALAMLTLVAGKFSGCEPEDLSFVTDCNDCYDFQPDSANLIVYLTINADNDSIPLVFYKGPVEEGVIDWRDTATSETLYLYSEIDREYAVQATYKSGKKTILAFDSDKMNLSDGSEECGSPCYLVKGGILDLRLKE
jgi:hypothetical protein